MCEVYLSDCLHETYIFSIPCGRLTQSRSSLSKLSAVVLNNHVSSSALHWMLDILGKSWTLTFLWSASICLFCGSWSTTNLFVKKSKRQLTVIWHRICHIPCRPTKHQSLYNRRYWSMHVLCSFAINWACCYHEFYFHIVYVTSALS